MPNKHLVVSFAIAVVASGCEACGEPLEFAFAPRAQTIRLGETQPTLTVTATDPFTAVNVGLLIRRSEPVPFDATISVLSQRQLVIEGLRPRRTGFMEFGITYDPLGNNDTDAFIGGGFEVLAWQFAQVECYPDGTAIAAAARQTPPPTLELFGDCVVTSGGGNPVNALFGTVTCASPNGSASCVDGDVTCFGRGPAFGEAGTSIDVTWTANEVPAGSAALAIPEPLTPAPYPTAVTRGEALVIEVSGGSDTSRVVLTTGAPKNGSTITVECTAPASDGRVVLPGEATALFEPGTLRFSLVSVDLAQPFLGDFRVDTRVHGDIVGPTIFDVVVQ